MASKPTSEDASPETSRRIVEQSFNNIPTSMSTTTEFIRSNSEAPRYTMTEDPGGSLQAKDQDKNDMPKLAAGTFVPKSAEKSESTENGSDSESTTSEPPLAQSATGAAKSGQQPGGSTDTQCVSNDAEPTQRSGSNVVQDGSLSATLPGRQVKKSLKNARRHDRPFGSMYRKPRPIMIAKGNIILPPPHMLPKRQGLQESSKTLEEPVYQPIIHRVAYHDIEEQLITTNKWQEPFNLDKARKFPEGKDPAFEVLTELSTSIPTPRFGWSDLEIRRVLGEGVLDNSDITISIKTTEIRIKSIPLIKAIAKVVSYDPLLSSKTKLHLADPFQLIAHNLEELQQLHAGPGLDELDHSDIARSHLGTLLDFVKQIYGDAINEEKARHRRNACTFRMLWLLFKPGTTVYVEAEGRLSAHVIHEVNVDESILTTAPGEPIEPCSITLWSLSFDGRYVGRCARSITIGEFDGEREVTSLKVVPCDFIDKNDEGRTRRQLEARGRRWYGLLCGKQVYYSGEVLEGAVRKYQPVPPGFFPPRPPGPLQPPPPPPPPPPNAPGLPTRRVRVAPYIQPFKLSTSGMQRSFEGRVYVDPAAYYSSTMNMAPVIGAIDDIGEDLAMCPCGECQTRRAHPPKGFRWARYDVLDPAKETDLTLVESPEGPMHRYLLCDWEIPGFILKSRTWERLDVACCQDHKRDLGALDKLVMLAERKEMIKALVHKFGTGTSEPAHRAWRADFIENKGEGRVFLLHGSPGVGKTYVSLAADFSTPLIHDLKLTEHTIEQTAECIAEYTDRALLSVTCADIGNDEVEMEGRLSEWFRLAEKWGAVMLIDEADVYLEQRSKNDLHRNSLVYVFLRCIEYYRGILFLTTNRVGNFDDAFVSRIHVVLSYEDLGEKQRKAIWKQFFNKLCDDREDFTVTKRARTYILGDDEDAICKLEWNGREIRNVFQTAVALAEYRFLQRSDRTDDDGPTLDQKDFEQVCQMTRQFKDYLYKVHGAEENERAFQQKARALPDDEQ